MIFSRAPDSSKLAKYVSRIWTYSCKPDPGYEKIFPTPNAQLLINLYGQTLSHWTVDGSILREAGSPGLQGVLTEPVMIDRIQKTDICGVQFAVGGLSAFTDQYAERFVNHIVDAADIWGDAVFSLREELQSTMDPKHRCAQIESFLLQRFHNNQIELEMLRKFTDLLDSGENVTTLQNTQGISQRRLHALFDRHVGIRPKHYSRIARFTRTLPGISKKQQLSRIALDLGYSDQAHMTREFQQFASSSPRSALIVDGEPNHAYVETDEIFKKYHSRKSSIAKN